MRLRLKSGLVLAALCCVLAVVSAQEYDITASEDEDDLVDPQLEAVEEPKDEETTEQSTDGETTEEDIEESTDEATEESIDEEATEESTDEEATEKSTEGEITSEEAVFTEAPDEAEQPSESAVIGDLEISPECGQHFNCSAEDSVQEMGSQDNEGNSTITESEEANRTEGSEHEEAVTDQLDSESQVPEEETSLEPETASPAEVTEAAAEADVSEGKEPVPAEGEATSEAESVKESTETATSTRREAVISGECSSSVDGCCPDGVHPAHGANGLGCCTTSKFGCCADHVTAAEGPFGEGCNCSSTEFGCCPDETTPASGLNHTGCGCQYSAEGCPDQSSYARDGCPCDTHPHGCCPDGLTAAQGDHFEGCPACNSAHGCCPDGLTPRASDADDACGCEASEHGCCLDGVTPAAGPGLAGCRRLPGEECGLKPDTGTCTDYVTRWFYDSAAWGGCNRFWWGGCDPGRNHFDDEESCAAACVSPRGSSVCFLQKMAGPCDGKYLEWYYDLPTKRCMQFVYSGCLGNGNRFASREKCEDMCLPDRMTTASACDLPKAEGACAGNFSRWFYNSQQGACEQFEFSGCLGNRNRFVSAEECESACRHKTKTLKSDTVCRMEIDSGNCSDSANQTLARWAHDNVRRRCVPFYFTGCEGNENNFGSKMDCEKVCPTTFPAIISLPAGNEILAERGSTDLILPVVVRANPPANVRWSHNGADISVYDPRVEFSSDHVLRLRDSVRDSDGGSYLVTAHNGVGESASKTITVVVYPTPVTVSIDLDKSIFRPGSDVTVPCLVSGYPPPSVRWLRLGRRAGVEAQPVEESDHVLIETVAASTWRTTSTLVVRNASNADSGTYRCEAESPYSASASGASAMVLVQWGPGERCVDRPSYAHCGLVVAHKFCANRYYGRYCCRSCSEAGYVPGGDDTDALE